MALRSRSRRFGGVGVGVEVGWWGRRLDGDQSRVIHSQLVDIFRTSSDAENVYIVTTFFFVFTNNWGLTEVSRPWILTSPSIRGRSNVANMKSIVKAALLGHILHPDLCTQTNRDLKQKGILGTEILLVHFVLTCRDERYRRTRSDGQLSLRGLAGETIQNLIDHWSNFLFVNSSFTELSFTLQIFRCNKSPELVVGMFDAHRRLHRSRQAAFMPPLSIIPCYLITRQIIESMQQRGGAGRNKCDNL